MNGPFSIAMSNNPRVRLILVPSRRNGLRPTTPGGVVWTHRRGRRGAGRMGYDWYDSDDMICFPDENLGVWPSRLQYTSGMVSQSWHWNVVLHVLKPTYRHFTGWDGFDRHTQLDFCDKFCSILGAQKMDKMIHKKPSISPFLAFAEGDFLFCWGLKAKLMLSWNI